MDSQSGIMRDKPTTRVTPVCKEKNEEGFGSFCNEMKPHKMIEYENSTLSYAEPPMKIEKRHRPHQLIRKTSCRKFTLKICREDCVKARSSGCSVFSCSNYKKPKCLGWSKKYIQAHH